MKSPWYMFVATYAIVQLFFVTGTYGFSCYECKSGDPCDDVTEQMKMDCTSPLGAINTCIKAKVSGNIIRSCGVPGTNINKCTYDGAVSVCMCESDLCNGVTRTSGLSVFGSLVAVVITAVFRRLVWI